MRSRAWAVPLLLVLSLLAGGLAVGLRPLPRAEVRPLEFRPPASKAEAGRTNVVVVVGCTFRADRTTPYGGPVTTTPFLESLAHEGTRFEDTIAQAPWTKPGITAVLTSRFPLAVGVTHPGDGMDDRQLAPRVTTLAERMKAAGYRTIGGSANPNGNSIFGFNQGFDHYFEPTDLWLSGMVKIDGDLLVDDALAQIDGSESPFYLQLLLVDAHFPFTRGLDPAPFRADAPTQRVAQYHAMLRQLDDTIAALDRGLRERGHDERDTIFVVVGDHGEGLLLPRSHGKGHGFYLYPPNVRVPWLMRGPGVARGHVVSGLAAQVDVVPTLLGLLDLPAPGGPGDSGSDGLDLSAFAAGGRQPIPEREIFVDTWFRGANRAAVYTTSRFCQKDYDPAASVLREARAQTRGKIEQVPPFPDACYDWREDPESVRPLPDPALQADLDRWREAQGALRVAFDAEGSGGAVMDEETTKALEGLGYLE